MNRWREIWRKREAPGEATDLESLIHLDGFDNGAGKADAEAWTRFGRELARRLGMQPADSVFEVGCGSGALLYLFHAAGHRVGGADFSPRLAEVARRAMPGVDIAVCEACDVAGPAHDFVLANSVFSYFPDHDYARRVLARMLAMAHKGVAILDVPDLDRREDSEAARRAALPPGEYERRYAGLEHLHYERAWFARETPAGWGVRVENQWLENYGNAPYRFNVLIGAERPG